MKPRHLLALAAAAATLAVAPTAARADVDPAGCTSDLQYDASIPTYNSVLGTPLGGGTTGTSSRQLTRKLLDYQRAVVAATASNPRVRVIEKKMSDTALGQEVWYSVISTPDNIANLDAGRNDAAFWAGVREGNISTEDGLAQVRDRPAFTWVTATPHGNEPAAGEASMRLLYEMAARLDCSNARRLKNLTTFIAPATNPDGRDLNTRQTAWGFDPNRDRGTRVNIENDGFTAAIVKYPGVFVIDAHQQTNGYFFPPNEDAVHHEVSQFAIDFIQHDIGPMLQQMFNDQSVAYQNYNIYDLFAPIYGDSVPALLDGAAGMTYEKGSTEVYGKQVYDHYLAMDATQNITSDQKVDVLTGWVKQWGEARQQGEDCLLQPNKLVSPLHTQIFDQPDTTVCGYYFPPGQSSGDTARLIRELTTTGVHVYRFNTDAAVAGAHDFGPNGNRTRTLPAGTLYVPMAQGQKHWIQAILGENPYLPYPYNYDVVEWSYPLTRGIAGSGFLTEPLINPPSMTEISDAGYGGVTGAGSPVYAFDTDSAQALGLVTELLGANVKVARAASRFSAANRVFKTGAALVDGSSLGGVDLAALAVQRGTPIYGLPNFPVERYPLVKPKIGLWTGSSIAPTANPIPLAGTTQGNCGSGYCEALFVLTQKNKIPASLIYPITPADLAAGRLVNESFTALVYPSNSPPQLSQLTPANDPVIQAGPQGAGLQDFVNKGGRYIGALTLGATGARNAGITKVNTEAVPGLNTPGSLYDGKFDTSSPLTWGFDDGGWIYRDLGATRNAVPLFAESTLVGDPAANIPVPKVAGRYGDIQPATGQMYEYGFDQNARGPGQLPNRAAVIDQPFGSGHALLLGFNPFYRAWIDGEERFVLNGILYPVGSPVAPDATPAQIASAKAPAAAPIAKAKLPAVKSRPDRGGRATNRDLKIKVKRSQAATLRSAVKRARLSKRLRAKVRYTHTRATTTLVMRNVRTDDPHARNAWVIRIMDGLAKHKVRPITAQV